MNAKKRIREAIELADKSYREERAAENRFSDALRSSEREPALFKRALRRLRAATRRRAELDAIANSITRASMRAYLRRAGHPGH